MSSAALRSLGLLSLSAVAVSRRMAREERMVSLLTGGSSEPRKDR